MGERHEAGMMGSTNVDADGAPDSVAHALVQIEAALLERQTLLAGRDTPAARDRIDALGLRVAALLEQIARVQPPAALDLDDEAPGEFDRFLDRGGAERRAG